jgi:hypothetical protein
MKWDGSINTKVLLKIEIKYCLYYVYYFFPYINGIHNLKIIFAQTTRHVTQKFYRKNGFHP